MLFVGLAFIAAAAVALRLARPRKGVVKMVNSPLLGDLTALSIAAAGVIGVVITLVGLGRF